MLKVENQAENTPQNAESAQLRLPRWAKWTGVSALTFIIFGGLFLLLLPMGLNQTILRSRLESQIAGWSGMTLAVKGEASISFFPFKATLTDVTSNDALGAVTVTAQKLEARFSALSVLTGKVDVKELWLDGARVTLRQRPGVKLGEFAESGPLKPAIEIAKAALETDRNDPDLGNISNRPLGSVRFSNSSLTFIWTDGREDRVMDVNATLQWLRLRGNAKAAGAAFWRGENVNFDLNVANPLVLAAGGTSALSLDFKSAPLAFVFGGDANLAADFFADGKLTLKAASISRVLSWSAAPMTAAGNLGALDISAKLTTTEGKLKFGDLQLSLDGNPATGTIEFDPSAKPAKLSGTLAFDAIDFASISEALPLGQPQSAGPDSDSPPLSGIDLDLRLSAETAKAGPWLIRNAAGTIRVDHGDAQLDLGNGELAGGGIAGSLRLWGAGAKREGAAKFAARAVAPGLLSNTDAAFPLADAPVDFQFDLAGAFGGLPEFLQTGEGKLTAEAAAGTIRNFSAASFAAAVLNGQIFALTDVYSGLSALESASLTATLKQGAAIVEASEFNVDGQRIILSGAIPYQSGGVALNGVIAPQSDPGNSAPFFIGGSWDKPFVTLVPLPN